MILVYYKAKFIIERIIKIKNLLKFYNLNFHLKNSINFFIKLEFEKYLKFFLISIELIANY